MKNLQTKSRLISLVASFALIACGTSSCVPTAVFSAASSATMASAKDRTFGATVDDNLIFAKIKKDFISKGFKKLYAKIHVDVVQSRVLLAGDVEAEEDIMTALDIAWSVKGVKEVINELKVTEDSNRFDLPQYTKDTWISGRVKSALFFDRSIKFINYSVLVQKNIVYLFGIARTEEELAKVAEIASKVGGVERVVSYVHLREVTVRPDSIPDSIEGSDKSSARSSEIGKSDDYQGFQDNDL